MNKCGIYIRIYILMQI